MYIIGGSLLLILIHFLVNIYINNIEGFVTNTSPLPNSAPIPPLPTNTSGISSLISPNSAADYMYLDPITDANKITDATMNKIIIQNANNLKITHTDTAQYKKDIMPLTTETEGQYYIKNGAWPWDNFITNYMTYIKTTPDYQKMVNPPSGAGAAPQNGYVNLFNNSLVPAMYPNRVIFNVLNKIIPQLFPNVTFLLDDPIQSVFHSKNGYAVGDGKNLKCRTNGQLELYSPNGTRSVISDYSKLPKLLKGFEFISSSSTPNTPNTPIYTQTNTSCNVCSSNLFSSTPCMFAINGQVAPVYEVLWGTVNPATIASQTPVNNTSFPLLSSATNTSSNGSTGTMSGSTGTIPAPIPG